jgi:short subunit dehydrogenase-like uncharacterized protein
VTGRPPHVVLFGATGFTGRLTAAALVRRGVPVVLAGRSAARLAEVADEVGATHTAVADADDRRALADLLHEGDVLVSTVGPFLRHGRVPVTTALDTGATYLDSTGEPPFVRWVFEQLGPRAAKAGVALVPAFGYDYVPGNLAAAVAVRAAGRQATRVDVGYFVVGGPSRLPGGISGGTAASVAAAALEPSFAWREGRLVTERSAAHVRGFDLPVGQRQGVSVGGTEHLSLPRWAPQLERVGVFVGWTGPLSRPTQVLSLGTSALAQVPPLAAAMAAAAARVLPGSSGGPAPERRAAARSVVVAEAFDDQGERLATATVEGPSPYDLTAELLAWGADVSLTGGLQATGALGPVEAFGLDGLETGCASLGLGVSELTAG